MIRPRSRESDRRIARFLLSRIAPHECALYVSPTLADVSSSIALPLTTMAAGLFHAADLLMPDLARGRRISTAALRSTMETACGGSSESARRLFAMSNRSGGTLADVYLRLRGIDPMIVDVRALRFHLSCYYREDDTATKRMVPALIAAVTDSEGRISGVHRTWLDPDHIGEKAPVGSPRRAMGDLLGSGVRFGMSPHDMPPIMVAGKGLETMMSLRMVMPELATIAGLSANHLAAILLSPSLQRLYIAVDADPAGRHGMERLSRRARQVGIEVRTLVPKRGDFNDDLRHLGPVVLARGLRDQLIPKDADRFLIAT